MSKALKHVMACAAVMNGVHEETGRFEAEGAYGGFRIWDTKLGKDPLDTGYDTSKVIAAAARGYVLGFYAHGAKRSDVESHPFIVNRKVPV